MVADKGYFRTEDIAACEKAGLTPYVPRPQRGSSASNGFFRKDEFRYDAERDAYACPGGHELKPFRFGKLREMTKIDYANKEACRDCPLRPRCTDAGYRAVSRLEREGALDRMAARLKARPWILDRRRETDRRPFGTIKQWMNQGAFLTRGLEKVRAEFSLTALVYNLRRALNILGMGENDGGGRRLTGAHVALFNRKPGHGGLPYAIPNATGAISGRYAKKRRPERSAVASITTDRVFARSA